MQQRTSRRVYWNEGMGRYRIEITQGRVTAWPGIRPDTGEWSSWLQQIPSFAFQARDGKRFTARKETRKRGSVYWIAYRHRSGLLLKKYIGPSIQVTTARLEKIADELEMRGAPKA